MEGDRKMFVGQSSVPGVTKRRGWEIRNGMLWSP